MSAVPDPDAELMLRVKRGDMEAFTALVEKYKQPVINLIARTIHDETEAEDVAQNVFLQVHKSAARYEVSAKFTTWLFTIARNLCLNEIRRRVRHPGDSLDAAPRHADEDQPARQFEDTKNVTPDAAAAHSELEQKIEEALAALPENQRTAILLYQRQDMSYEEIAVVLGCSLASVKSLIFRGREALKERLKPYLRTGEWTSKNERNFD